MRWWWSLGLSAVLGVWSSPAVGQVNFLVAPSFPAGDSPQSVALGDIDGDGDTDIATANADSDDVSVLLNDGTGTFAPARSFAAGDSPRSVALGDLDGDGDLDVATANRGSYPSYGNVSVLLNDGTGTFAPAQSFAVGYSPSSVALGDLDGDGDLDVASANFYSKDVSVLLNVGGGSFAPAQAFVAGNRPKSVALGDIDGDGDLDIATANYRSETVIVFQNITQQTALPAIASLAPRSGPVGTEVTLTGTGFTAATAVTFRDGSGRRRIPAQFTVVSDSEIRAVVPAGAATGRLTVTTSAGRAVSPVAFFVIGR
ncbi:MAG: VCBS repeat-containing protein [Aphanocapsa lilacina HA4352-LM1]|jgi:predicted nucleotidyltransferase|nr:VCBS repeat-containing protein [Aphanocapsa lilacina HA4352-LM1]